MPNKRVISSDIYVDEWFSELSLLERFIWIGIFTTCADSQGRTIDKAVHIRTCIFPYEDMPLESINQAIIKFADAQKILRYEIKGGKYIQILRWWSYQCPRFAGASKFPAPPGWQDHINTTVGKVSIKQNWDTAVKHKEQEQAYIDSLSSVTEAVTEPVTDTNIASYIETNIEDNIDSHISIPIPNSNLIPIPNSVSTPSAPAGAQNALPAASTPPTALNASLSGSNSDTSVPRSSNKPPPLPPTNPPENETLTGPEIAHFVNRTVGFYSEIMHPRAPTQDDMQAIRNMGKLWGYKHVYTAFQESARGSSPYKTIPEIYSHLGDGNGEAA